MNVVFSLAVLAIAAPADPTLLQFSSQRCPHCQAMQPIVAQLAQQGVVVQVVDVDQQLNIARDYKVQGVPTFVALKAGQEAGRIEGVTTAEKLLALARGSGFGVQGSGGSGQDLGARSLGIEGSTPEQVARSATVRIKVEDATGFGFGTGTIIDTHDHESLVVTCGHLFRESKGQGRISADVFNAGAAQTVTGQLIAYNLDRDIALISLQSAAGVRPATIAPPSHAVRPGDRVFTIGCDKGAEPSLRPTHITAVNKYKGKPNFTAAGQPIDGRSGGGLFTAEGYLIGICNAADPADDEGLYAGLASIHWQLDQIGQSEVYQRAARVAAAAPAAPASPAGLGGPGGPSESALLTSAPPQMPTTMPPSSTVPIAAASDDSEIVFIVRSKRDPAQRSEVFVIDQAPPDLIARITHAAQQSGQRRAAIARAGQTARVAANPPSAAAPIVRGQSGEY